MFVESDYLKVRLSLSHEEASSFARFLQARQYGGEMHSGDAVVVDTVLSALQDHNNKILKREALINAVQTQADAEFNQLKKPVRIEVNNKVGIYEVLRDS